MSAPEPPPTFALLNEIGIIEQLASTLFESRLPDGVLVSHFSVLNHLARRGDGATPLSLATAFQVPKTTMTHTLQGLERRGWIAMEPNPRDGRSKIVRLTEAGRAFAAEAVAALAPDIAEIERAVPRERIEATLPVLREIRAFLDAARD